MNHLLNEFLMLCLLQIFPKSTLLVAPKSEVDSRDSVTITGDSEPLCYPHVIHILVAP